MPNHRVPSASPAGRARRRLLTITICAILPIVAILAATAAGFVPSPSERQRVAAAAATLHAPSTCFATTSARTVPAAGTLLWGAIPDWPHISAYWYAHRIGHAPAVYSVAQPFPLDPVSLGWTDTMLSQTRAMGAMMALTLNPTSLNAVTTASATTLATWLGGWNARGVGIFLRFAPEMNGAWFTAWGQQPTEYRAAAQKIAAAVHHLAPRTAIIWAPNISSTGTSLRIRTGLSAADFAALDTNHNHKLDSGDNAYSPYYPGDSSVDWVALSLYSRGHGWPRVHNDVPYPNELFNQIGHAVRADGSLSWGFYDQFALRHHKPMALAETAAAWAPNRTGATELAVKQAWWRQVFDLVRSHRLTSFKMAIFFEVDKPEIDIGPHTYWSIDHSSVLAAAFAQDLGRYQVMTSHPC